MAPLLSLAALFAPCAWAGAESRPAATEAAGDIEGPMRLDVQALYDRGLARYAAHDYPGAIADFQAGYAIEPRREFLFAEGQARRLAGDCKGAIALYQRFLATSPPAVQVNATQIALGRCAQLLAERPEVVMVQPPRPPPPPPAPPPIWWRDRWGLGLTGAGAIGLAVGAGFLAAAYAARPHAGEAADFETYEALWSRAESRRAIAVGALIAGVGLSAAGVTRFVLVRRRAKAMAVERTATLWLGPGQLGIGGAF